MSIIWDLKKIDISPNPLKQKLFKLRKKGTLLLTKSYSYNNIKSQKTPKNISNFKNIINIKTEENNSERGKKLIEKNTRLKIKLNNINKKLILAKSANHKKDFKLQQNNKLLFHAIDIKKKTLDYEQNDKITSNYYFNKKKENDIAIEGFKSNLIHKIKRQYLDLENEFENKNNIIKELKDNIINFNKKAVISKNKKIMNNLIAIKNKYDENLKENNEYKLKMKEYIELEDDLNKKNFCILELQETFNNINISNNNLESDIEKLKNKLKSLEFENENLNKKYYSLKERVIQSTNDKNDIENKYAILIDENKEKNENYNY